MHDAHPYSYYATPSVPGAAPRSRTITVTGQGILYVKPDTVTITLGIRTEHTNALEALSSNSKRVNAMIQALEAIGIHKEEIDTISFSIYPKYTYTNNIAVLAGYEVEHLFEITVKDVKTVGMIYEAAVTNGANIARELQFKLAHEQPYYQQALALAVKNAQEKAIVLARTLSLPLHDTPIELKEQTISSIHPSPQPRTTVLAASAAPPIQTQDVTIIAIVHAVFTY
ncbi:SIMPL domain-containing protein [Anoxybacillus sp. UARK-01]|uniref:SIMPL domain-containing protein n=1 Tax=Anoxybacillus sp. UARK-01 TaxID=1895648 RepID=UPI0009BC713F|nr:SIMPL domain-containing protein [Anoxybacillus sp. UARK-01]OQM44388.1 SIMPL domain-containing protein [Anoxybacillus sp. UARK-01]